jgi:hypothetical protein
MTTDIKFIRLQMEEILHKEGVEYEKQGYSESPQYVFPAGSTVILLGLVEKSDHCILIFYSPLLGDITEKDAAFAMVKLNHQLPFGSLVYHEDQKEIGISYMMAIDNLGTKELMIPLKMLQNHADQIDDMLQEIIGGTKTQDRTYF